MLRNIFIIVVYDILYLNYGNMFNFKNGVFIELFVMFYVFLWLSVVNLEKIFDGEIVVNGKRKGMGNCNNELCVGFENCDNIVFFVFKFGDNVYICIIVVIFLYGFWLNFKRWKV